MPLHALLSSHPAPCLGRLTFCGQFYHFLQCFHLYLDSNMMHCFIWQSLAHNTILNIHYLSSQNMLLCSISCIQLLLLTNVNVFRSTVDVHELFPVLAITNNIVPLNIPASLSGCTCARQHLQQHLGVHLLFHQFLAILDMIRLSPSSYSVGFKSAFPIQ